MLIGKPATTTLLKESAFPEGFAHSGALVLERVWHWANIKLSNVDYENL